jgi:hypothetical protein
MVKINLARPGLKLKLKKNPICRTIDTFHILLVVLMLSGCRREHVEPVYVDGTQQNVCMTMANTASEARYGMPADKSVKAHTEGTAVWVADTEFIFSSDKYFLMRNKYLAEPFKNEPSKYIEGLWAGARYSVEDLAQHYPDTFSAGLESSSPFYLDLICSPGNSAGSFSAIRTEGKVETVDRDLGLINYTYRNGISSIPINDSIRNVDGSPILIECSTVYKTCSAAFTLVPTILIKYSYPLSQRPNWQKIQKFVVSILNNAKE